MKRKVEVIKIFLTTSKKVFPVDYRGNLLNRVTLKPESEHIRYISQNSQIEIIAKNDSLRERETKDVTQTVEMSREEYLRIRETRQRGVDNWWKGYNLAMQTMSPYIQAGGKIPKRVIQKRDLMIKEIPHPMSMHELILRYNPNKNK
jgi:hypothetical protein